ncbi:MAG: hypothetical protein IPM26_01320 [Saprospiraceae bacterium]|nr:hypothetical protein [Saprospiraceae bacterium]
MKVLKFTLALVLSVFSTMYGQESFEARIRSISRYMDKITKEEKEKLRSEVAEINQKLNAGQLTPNQAEVMKAEAAERSARTIESRLAPYQEELLDLTMQKAEGKVLSEEDWDNERDKPIRIEINRTRKREIRGERRTTTQFIFAFGLNNALRNGEFSSLSDSEFRVSNGRFYEWGLSGKTRLAKENNLLHLKYGVSLIYNNLRPTDNRVFAVNGNQTVLVPFEETLSKNAYFRNTQLVFPLHLEFDFTPKKVSEEKIVFRTQKSWRLGMGGYAGFNLRTRQIIDYRVNGYEVEESTRGEFNTNNFIYGLGAYLGYRDLSLYCKMDLNDLFRNEQAVNYNNFSVGLRFDFN